MAMTHSHDFDISDCGEQAVKSFGIEVPEWIEQDISCYKVTGVNQGGCESGAYMPAVTYHKALDTMNKHGNAVLDYIEETTGECSIDCSNKSWAGVAVAILSFAVELWCSQAEDDITEILEEREADFDHLVSEWPFVRECIVNEYGENDIPALDEGFNDWTDSLCKDGTISEWAYANVTREEIEGEL